MSERSILITDHDRRRLLEALRDAYSGDYRGSAYLNDLMGELEKAKIVDLHEVPPDVITMNSKVRLMDLDEQDVIEFTLVFPQDADLRSARVSVLAPIGTAVLGYRVGDAIKWSVPDGVRNLVVLELLYQPESAGDFNL